MSARTSDLSLGTWPCGEGGEVILPEPLLGRHEREPRCRYERRCAPVAGRPPRGKAAITARPAEVDHFDCRAAGLAQQDVLRLEVAMHDRVLGEVRSDEIRQIGMCPRGAVSPYRILSYLGEVPQRVEQLHGEAADELPIDESEPCQVSACRVG